MPGGNDKDRIFLSIFWVSIGYFYGLFDGIVAILEVRFGAADAALMDTIQLSRRREAINFCGKDNRRRSSLNIVIVRS